MLKIQNILLPKFKHVWAVFPFLEIFIAKLFCFLQKLQKKPHNTGLLLIHCTAFFL